MVALFCIFMVIIIVMFGVKVAIDSVTWLFANSGNIIFFVIMTAVVFLAILRP